VVCHYGTATGFPEEICLIEKVFEKSMYRARNPQDCIGSCPCQGVETPIPSSEDIANNVIAAIAGGGAGEALIAPLQTIVGNPSFENVIAGGDSTAFEASVGTVAASIELFKASPVIANAIASADTATQDAVQAEFARIDDLMAQIRGAVERAQT